ncbi:MAG: efflux RND transporter periplasmic adaptor subunit [Proteobacteria bacterium]|nr:efflux RND transporter periplasmic adaptor subunit [Pseudomonadota bacterium]
MIARAAYLLTFLAVLLAGCSRETPAPEAIRPVRTEVVTVAGASDWMLSGDVRPRHETRLAFRVPGQMIARKVELGARVRAGQPIARLDARDLVLARANAQAGLAQVQSQAALAEADLKRFADLRARSFISQAEYDRRDAQARQAREQVAAGTAQRTQAQNAVTYATLVAPHAGVVTAIEAEAGQVLAAGQTVVRLARPEELEIAVNIPEHRLAEFRAAGTYAIQLWSVGKKTWRGSLRELAPVADPASRTYAARVAIEGENAALAIGMSAEVKVPASGAQSPSVPATAIFHAEGRPAIWVVDGTPATVRLVPVVTGAAAGNRVAITQGLAAGDRIVTAGVGLLRPGQRVRLLDAGALARGAR